MSTGYFSISGYQIGTETANRINLGPFNVPYGGVGFCVEYSLGTGTTTIAMNSFSAGVAIIPPIGSPPAGVTMKMKTVSGDSGTFISTEQPTIIEWDTANAEVPANLYLVVAGGSITVTVQYL